MSGILIVCGAGIVSGKEIMAIELGAGLAESGESVSFITSFWNNGDFPERLKRGGFPTYSLPIGFISATLTIRCLDMTIEQIRHWPGLLWDYSRLLRRLKPQKIVHTNWHHLLLLLPLLRPGRDLFWVHDLVPDAPHYRRLYGWFGRRIEAFVCVSQATACCLQKLGIPDAKIRVIHNGITDPAGSTRIIHCRPRKFRIGIVGQVGAWKGHDDLLEAFAVIAQAHCEVELHIFGKGSEAYRTKLIRRSVELGVADSVKWHDFVADRQSIYSELDVCVIPSRAPESFGLSALEAGFFTKPAIVTSRGALPEIIEHEVNGLVVEAECPGQIADALARLIEEPGLRERLAANARKRAVEHFGRERFINDFLALLNEGSPKVKQEPVIA